MRDALNTSYRLLVRLTQEDASDLPSPDPRRRHYVPGTVWETAVPVGVDRAVAAARAFATARMPGQWYDGHIWVDCGIKGGQSCWIVSSDDAPEPGDADWIVSIDGFTDYFVSAWTGRCIGWRGYPGRYEYFLPNEDLRDQASRPKS